ncbi:MAG: undecaprenyl-diphosphate phosphatase [Lachnospiraceae bacterium]|nr:undecaprenyl-diphosphate phosphatase [Lachnospiraceae bacterium]
MDWIKTIIYGIVEGVTEWLPVSSTGHMILLEHIMPMNVSEDFWEMYLVVIQLGAILAVVLMFWNQLWPFTTKEKGYVDKDIFSMWFKIIVACIPAAVVELIWGDVLEAAFYRYQVVACMLVLVGIVFLVVEKWNKDRQPEMNTITEITYRAAFLIGMFQLIAALFPGTSRSGATIIGGLIIGLSRTVAAEFTFFLAVPVMFGASLMKVLHFGLLFTPYELGMLLAGMVVAFIVSMIVIRFLLGYIRKHDFKIFGWYRIILGVTVLVFFGLFA